MDIDRNLMRPHLVALLAFAALALVPAAGARSASLIWASPTQPDRHRFRATRGKQLSLTLAASTSAPGAVVVIEPVKGLPAGASIATAAEGSAAHATFRWKP